MICDTATFLDAVVPKGNRYIGFTNGKLNNSGREIINCSAFTDADSGQRIGFNHGNRERNVYFALASFKQAKIYDEKNGYEKSYRHQDNVDKLKSVWLDVDFKSYDSKKAAVEGIQKFLETNIPKPTFVVGSGGGVHLYWCFEEELNPGHWITLAQGLAGYAKQMGLRADFGVTIDSARVLRLPGTRNQKYDGKPECEVKAMNAYVSVDRMFELLTPYAAAQQDPRQQAITVSPNVINMLNPAAGGRELMDNYTPNVQSNFAAIVEACPTIAHEVETGGRDTSYTLWKDTLHLLAYVTDGADYVASVSDQYHGYDPDETAMRFDESVRAKQDNKRGPTTCERFSMSSDKCASCKWLGKIKSPWSLGVTKKAEVTGPSFVLHGETYKMKYVEDDNGNMTAERMMIIPAALDNWRLMLTTSEDHPFQLWVDVSQGKTHNTIKLTTSVLADPKALRVACTDQGLALEQRPLKNMQEIAMAWVNHLLKENPLEEAVRFGWSGDFKSFVLGEDRIYAAETIKVVQENFVENYYDVRGTAEPWTKLAKLLVNHDNPAYAYMLCAGMAGPLMPGFHQSGSMILSAYSERSGAGKSTVMECVQSAFSDPKKGMFSMDDTSNAIIERVGIAQGLPAMWDEIKGEHIAREVAKVTFRLIQGTSKSRLTRDAKVRKTFSTNTMLLCSTNTPLVDYVNAEIVGTDAGLARFLEFEMQGGIKIDPEIDGLRSQLVRNYGHTGREYIHWLIQHHDEVKKAENEFLKLLSKKREWKSEERFWLMGTAKIMTAAYALKMSGLCDVELKKVMDFGLEVVECQREVVTENNETKDEVLSRFARYYADKILVTDKFKRGGGKTGGTVKVERAPDRSGIVVHVGVAEFKMRVSKSELRSYVQANNLSMRKVMNQLKTEHSAKELKATLGGGTNYVAPSQENCIEIDLGALGQELVATFASSTPDSGKASTSSQPATPGS